MNTESRIDAALRWIGSRQPPAGLERRLLARLEEPQRRSTAVRSLSAFAIAASLAVAVLALGPLTAGLGAHHASAAGPFPHVVPAKGAFGTASAVHVPSAPLPLVSAPVNHGRGHTRSGRVVLPAESASPRGGASLPPETAGRLVLGGRVSVAPATLPAAP